MYVIVISALPNIYARHPRACLTKILHFWHSKICPNLLEFALPAYIETDSHYLKFNMIVMTFRP